MDLMKFIFDLDGTVAQGNIMSIVSDNIGYKSDIKQMLTNISNGELPFVEGFIRCVHILGQEPIDKINKLIENITLNSRLLKFIQLYSDDCIVVTENLDCWLVGLGKKIDCRMICSEAVVKENKVIKIKKMLKKESIIKEYQEKGYSVVYIGSGFSSYEAIRVADISIVSALSNKPFTPMIGVADYLVYTEAALIRQLEMLVKHMEKECKSVVISCAGVGARLGLATTKALIDINGKSIIRRQLEMLFDVEDIRIVIGYQAADVINEVLKIRRDVIFCYNHEYFDTKTGASLYIGAKHGNEYIIAIDGDLILSPDDMLMLLKMEGEWIAYSKITSDDAVFLSLNEKGEVREFSRDEGEYEWTGPACIRKNRLNYNAPNVFNQLEPILPIKGVQIRACDIDTYDDYIRAQEFVGELE